MVKIKGREAWIWVAYEPVLRVFLRFRISFNQSGLDAYLFLKEVRARYGRNTWTDEATFYPEACRLLHLEHHVYSIEWKNLVERMNQALKDRLECFDGLFPCFREGCDHRYVSNWVSVFRFFCNVIRGEDDQPEYLRFIKSLQEALS